MDATANAEVMRELMRYWSFRILIEIQTASYQWFLEEGLREMFQDISPIQDFTGNLVLGIYRL